MGGCIGKNLFFLQVINHLFFPLFSFPFPRHALLQASDIISMHLPLTPQTHGLINEASIAKMKKVRSIGKGGRGET